MNATGEVMKHGLYRMLTKTLTHENRRQMGAEGEQEFLIIEHSALGWQCVLEGEHESHRLAPPPTFFSDNCQTSTIDDTTEDNAVGFGTTLEFPPDPLSSLSDIPLGTYRSRWPDDDRLLRTQDYFTEWEVTFLPDNSVAIQWKARHDMRSFVLSPEGHIASFRLGPAYRTLMLHPEREDKQLDGKLLYSASTGPVQVCLLAGYPCTVMFFSHCFYQQAAFISL